MFMWRYLSQREYGEDTGNSRDPEVKLSKPQRADEFSEFYVVYEDIRRESLLVGDKRSYTLFCGNQRRISPGDKDVTEYLEERCC